MPLTLCSNCRLPVQANAHSCPQCGALRAESIAQHRVPIAAALAFVATFTLVALRLGARPLST